MEGMEQNDLMDNIFDDFKDINTASERYNQESSAADWNEEWEDMIGEAEIMTYLEKEVNNREMKSNDRGINLANNKMKAGSPISERAQKEEEIDAGIKM